MYNGVHCSDENVCGNLRFLTANLLDAKQFGIQRIIRQLGSCHGPAGGAPVAGAGGGVPAERVPRGKPLGLARRGEIVTKTQKLKTSTFL